MFSEIRVQGYMYKRIIAIHNLIFNQFGKTFSKVLIICFFLNGYYISAQAEKMSCSAIFEKVSDNEAWDPKFFTNPEDHDHNNFRYVVHMISRHHLRTKRSAEKIFSYLASTVSRNSNALLSATVIDNTNNGTFGSIGFIIRVPKENFVVANPEDIGSIFAANNRSASVAARLIDDYKNLFKYSLLPPEYVLGNTKTYNELIIFGRQIEGIEVTGVLIKENYRNGKKVISDSDENLQIMMRALAEKYGLPIVEIREDI